MKKVTLILFILTLTIETFYAQTNSTGTINLSSTSGLEFTAQIDITPSIVTLTLIGPSDRWLAIGFGASTMTSNKDVVIFSNSGLTDRTFTGVGSTPTQDSNQDWTVTSNTITSGKRTLVATRALNTGETNDYVFSTTDTSINLVWARGNGAILSLGNHGGANRGATSSGYTLNVKDNNLAQNFSIFPNPAVSKLHVVLPKNIKTATIDAFNVLGKHISTKNISELDYSLNVSNWNKGMYLIKVTANGISETKQFVKQ